MKWPWTRPTADPAAELTALELASLRLIYTEAEVEQALQGRPIRPRAAVEVAGRAGGGEGGRGGAG